MFKRVSNEGEVISIDDFLHDVNQAPLLPPRKKYKTLSRVVSGKAITDDPQVALTSNESNNDGSDVGDENDLCCVCGSFYVKSARNKF